MVPHRPAPYVFGPQASTLGACGIHGRQLLVPLHVEHDCHASRAHDIRDAAGAQIPSAGPCSMNQVETLRTSHAAAVPKSAVINIAA
jgi:hypothetical protein